MERRDVSYLLPRLSIVLNIYLHVSTNRRPVGWSGDGGVRESNKGGTYREARDTIGSGSGAGGGAALSCPARGYGGALIAPPPPHRHRKKRVKSIFDSTIDWRPPYLVQYIVR